MVINIIFEDPFKEIKYFNGKIKLHSESLKFIFSVFPPAKKKLVESVSVAYTEAYK